MRAFSFYLFYSDIYARSGTNSSVSAASYVLQENYCPDMIDTYNAKYPDGENPLRILSQLLALTSSLVVTQAL